MKILRIGDPHIKPNNLDEAEKLMHFINDKILELQPDRIEILGDLFHTHGIVRLEVLEFWDGWLDVLVSHENIEIFVLIGNHDRYSTDEFAYSAVSVFKHMLRQHKNLRIVELPRVDGPFAYVSHYHDPELFIEVANNCVKNYPEAKVLVCHQTFDGSHYEKGFYAPDGIDSSRLNYDLIISGHIHAAQTLMKDNQTIIYPGTPKWDTESDANEEKGIWLFEHDDKTGKILSQELLRTAGVVTSIVSLVWKEGQDLPAIPSGCKVSIELIGTEAWVEGHKASLKGHVSIKTKITDRADRKDRKAGQNFPEFVLKHFKTEMDRKELLLYMKGLKIV